MKNTQVCAHISDLCFDKDIDYKQLHSLICEAINESGENIDYPDISSVNRWVNKRTGTPDKKWIPFIAKALSVPEEEIYTGKETGISKAIKEANKWAEMYNLNQQEKERITRIIWWGKYELIIFGLFALDFGVLMLNLSIWKIGYVVLINLAFAICLVKYDNYKYKREVGIVGHQKLRETISDEVKFFKDLTQNSVVCHITSTIVVTICVLGFLPFIESLFYKGTYYLSASLYFVIGFILITQSIFRK